MGEFIDINGSFENGWRHAVETRSNQGEHWMEAAPPGTPGVQEYKLPNGWWSIWYDATRLDLHPHYDGQGFNRFVRPEFDLKEEWQLPDHEKKGGSDPLIRDGEITFKPFKPGAWRAELLRCDDLKPGYYYFSAWVRPDPVTKTDSQGKLYATDRAAFAYFVFDDDEQELVDLTPTDKRKAGWCELGYKFAADGETVYGLGFYCPFALKNSGFFCDGWTLEYLGPVENKHSVIAREPYARTYVLLPQNYGGAWARQAVNVCAEKGRKWTLGFAADDAGNGCGLSARRVLAVNPHKIGTGLSQAWYDEFYPGAKMWSIIASDPDEMAAKLKAWSPIEPTPSPPPPPTPSPPPITTTKVGFHNQLPFPGYLTFLDRAARAGRPVAAVKIVSSNYEEINTIKLISPTTLVVGRATDKDNPDWFLRASDYYKALDGSNFRHDFYRMVELGFDVIETPLNELIGTENPDVVKKVVDFEVAYCRWCRDKSRGECAPGVCNPGPGNPQHGYETSLLVPLAKETVKQAGYLMPHTYAPVTFEAGYTEAWMHSPQVQYDYHLRPVKSWLPTFKEHGIDISQLRFIFGEAGACAVHINHEGLPGGFKDSGGGWRRSDALNGDLHRYIKSVLVPYELQTQLYPQVVSWHIFTSGRVGWKWFQFNENEYDALWRALEM